MPYCLEEGRVPPEKGKPYKFESQRLAFSHDLVVGLWNPEACLRGSMNRALLKSMNQSSAKAGYALNLMGAPPKLQGHVAVRAFRYSVVHVMASWHVMVWIIQSS